MDKSAFLRGDSHKMAPNAHHQTSEALGEILVAAL
jgi:hypothetical protein